MRWNVVHRVHKKVFHVGTRDGDRNRSQIVRRWHIDSHSAETSDDVEAVTYFIDEMIRPAGDRERPDPLRQSG